MHHVAESVLDPAKNWCRRLTDVGAAYAVSNHLPGHHCSMATRELTNLARGNFVHEVILKSNCHYLGVTLLSLCSDKFLSSLSSQRKCLCEEGPLNQRVTVQCHHECTLRSQILSRTTTPSLLTSKPRQAKSLNEMLWSK